MREVQATVSSEPAFSASATGIADVHAQSDRVDSTASAVVPAESASESPVVSAAPAADLNLGLEPASLAGFTGDIQL